jgi:hypothetical protein
MPRNPRRQSQRRRLPPRPTYSGAPQVEQSDAHISRSDARPLRYVERESPLLAAELLRVAGVTATCFGLLALLTIIDRVQ